MAIRINGTTGIDMGNTPVSNVDVGVLPENAVTKQYVDDNVLLSPNDSRVKTALNASGEAPIYACRAWVNFNGAETVGINASGNVSSITDNGVGTYTVNLTAAMPDWNYSCNVSAFRINDVAHVATINRIYTTTQVGINTFSNFGPVEDSSIINISIFR